MIKKTWNEMLYTNRYLIVFMMGILVGTLLLNFYFRDRHNELLVYGRYIFRSISNVDVNKSELLLSIIIKRCREIAVIVILAYTIFGEFYTFIYILSKGITLGIAFSLAVYCYGIRGVVLVSLLGISYIIPYVMTVYLAINIALSIFKRRKVDIRYAFGLVLTVIIEILLECFV